MTTLVGAGELSHCVPDESPNADPHHPCIAHPDRDPARPDIGRPLLVGGLLIAFFGVVLFATGFAKDRSESATSAPRLPTAPFPLDMTAACALLTRRLDQAEFPSTEQLARYQVASCRGPLRVNATRAELSGVYLRDDTTLDEQRLNICFEHRTEWVVAKASAEDCDATFIQTR
ncbi:MAG TPA: hypothetical protein VHW01_08050 [Polyangiaceae bacterium]|nr:hypothetical protein [Polyangiaceae bacterium]